MKLDISTYFIPDDVLFYYDDLFSIIHQGMTNPIQCYLTHFISPNGPFFELNPINEETTILSYMHEQEIKYIRILKKGYTFHKDDKTIYGTYIQKESSIRCLFYYSPLEVQIIPFPNIDPFQHYFLVKKSLFIVQPAGFDEYKHPKSLPNFYYIPTFIEWKQYHSLDIINSGNTFIAFGDLDVISWPKKEIR